MVEGLPRGDVRGHIVKDAARRHWRLIALVAVLLGAAVGAYSYSRHATYTSSVTVVLRPLTGNALSLSTQNATQSTTVAMQTEATLVTSQAVTTRVNRTLAKSGGLPNAQVTTVVPANSQIVRIMCTAGRPARAQRCAQLYADTFLDYRAALATASQDAQLAKLNAQYATVRKQLQDASAQAARPNPPAEAAQIRNLTATDLANVIAAISQVKSLSASPGNVVKPATTPDRPNGISPAVLTGTITVIALIVGLGVAIWRERLDDRIRVSAEPEILGVPVLAMVPEGTTQVRYLESMRRARTSLLAAAAPNSVIAVSGLSATEHSSAIAADIARTMARAGYRMAFLDLALDASHDAFTAPGEFGVSDALLTGRIDDLAPVKVDDVDVIPVGSDPAAARERYSGQVMRDLVQRWRESHDFVIVATSPASSSDAMAVMLAMDGVVLIATDRHATHEQIAATNDALGRLDVRLLGIVVRRGTRKWQGHGAPQPPAREPVERKAATAPPTAAPVPEDSGAHSSDDVKEDVDGRIAAKIDGDNGADVETDIETMTHPRPYHGRVLARSSRERKRNQMMIAATRQHEERT